ncbi:hypothetical protein GGI11_002673 [Coemansia sp. RSA 2049]|nr:hypothetical protein GGI11_002673 [Coemansia sp. RSA 2049]
MMAESGESLEVPADKTVQLVGKEGKIVPGLSTPLELARKYDQKKSKHYVVARINESTLWDMQNPLPESTESVEFFAFTSTDDVGKSIFWKSSAHIMAIALQKIYGDELMLCNSSLVPGNGFYYDFFLFKDARDPVVDRLNKQGLSLGDWIDRLCGPGIPSEKLNFLKMDDMKKVQKTLLDISKKQYAFEFMDVSYDFARDIFAGNPFDLRALDLAQQAPKDSHSKDSTDKYITLFRCHTLVGIYQGPMIVNTRQMQELFPTNVSSVHSASYMSSSTNKGTANSGHIPPTVNRVNAISFPIAGMYKDHQLKVAEIARRNHRVVGKEQKLFMMHPWAPGSGFILPHGQRMVNTIMEAIRHEYAKYGYDEVSSPLIFNRKLWETSGHWENYHEDMFTISTKTESADQENTTGCCGSREAGTENLDSSEFGLKPMNCPGHCLIYANELRSYRDLPIRYADFSPLHRNEIAGALSGLTRVRKFHQDDGHIFCTRDQVQGEIERCIKMVDDIYNMFVFPSYEFVLSTRPDKYIGNEKEWDEAESALADALAKTGKSWTLNNGDGAFYGPKIDVCVQDALGRKHQTATIQLDFQLPQRFELKYTGVDGQQHRPVMIHRAVLGSMERMLAVLIEHWGGRWPFWVSPRQAMVIPVTTADEGGAIAKYAQEVRDLLANDVAPTSVDSHRFFVDVNLSGDTLNRCIREAQLAKYNFLLIVGEKETKHRTVTIRRRDGGKTMTMEIEQVKDMFLRLIETYK